MLVKWAFIDFILICTILFGLFPFYQQDMHNWPMFVWMHTFVHQKHECTDNKLGIVFLVAEASELPQVHTLQPVKPLGI